MRKILLATLTAGVMSAGVANAVTVSGGTITVTATVNSTCSATSTNLTFPGYTPGSGAKTGTATVNVKCTKNTGFAVALDKGVAGTFTTRLMSNGANTLEYNLYTTAAATTIFGDGTGSGLGATATVPGTGTGVSNTIPITVFGSLPDSANNQLALPGTYTDTINVTVSY